MRKILVLYSYNYGFAGGDRLLLGYLKYFPENGIEPELIFSVSPILKAEVDSLQTEYYEFDFYKSKSNSFIKNLNYIYVLKKVFKFIKDRKPEAILTLNTRSARIISFLKMVGLVTQPHIVIVQGKWKKITQGFIFKRAELIIAISEFIKSTILKRFHKKVRVIYNGTEIVNQFDDKDKIIYKKKIGFDASPLIFSAGRLIPEKGFEIFLYACKEILKNSKVNFLICGEGYLKQKLESLSHALGIFSNIKIKGFVEDISFCYKASDVFMCLSQWEEPFGLVAIEAMANGVPVIASKVGGLKEIVVNNQNGFLVEKSDYNQAARYALEIINNKDLYFKLSSCARKIVKNKFNIKISARYLSNYINLLCS